MPEWIEMTDYQRIATVARSAACNEMKPEGIADYINTPQVVDTIYRDATAAEFWGAMNDDSKLLLLDLVKAEDAGARLLWANLQVQGMVAVDPERISATVETLAAKATPATKARWDAVEGIASVKEGGKGEPVTFLQELQALCSREIVFRMVSAPVEAGGLGFIGHKVTAAEVLDALREVKA